MRGITLSEDFVSQIVGKPAAKISESKEGSEHVEAHVCPLCESHLEEPISEEKIQEHVDYFLEVINENFDIVGDDLDEEVSEEEGEELDESEHEDEGDEDEEDEDVDEAYAPKAKSGKPMKGKPPMKGTKPSKKPGC